MKSEEILLEALNTFGNFTTVTQEFNEDQLDVIFKAMELKSAQFAKEQNKELIDMLDKIQSDINNHFYTHLNNDNQKT